MAGHFGVCGVNSNPGRCPICGGSGCFYASATDIEYFTGQHSYKYLLCASCDLLFLEDMPAYRLKEIYPANYYSFNADNVSRSAVVRIKEWIDKRGFRRLLSQIEGEQIRVLDVGGGNGWLTGLIRELDSRVTTTQIVDIDPDAMNIARSRGHRYFCGPVEEFNTDERYELVLMLNLIEHVSDPIGVLRKAKDLLAPGGRIVIKTPNFRSLDARIFRHLSWGGFHCPRHFVLFSRGSFHRATQGAGLRVLDFSYTQGAPFWGVSILDLMRRAGLASVSASRPSIYHPFMPMLLAVSAAFDFLRKPFSALSQMVFTLGNDSNEISSGLEGPSFAQDVKAKRIERQTDQAADSLGRMKSVNGKVHDD